MAVLQIFNALVAFIPFNNSLSYRDSTSLISIKVTTKRKSQPVSLVHLQVHPTASEGFRKLTSQRTLQVWVSKPQSQQLWTPLE